MTVEASAPAKINLTLHVTGQRADGYHTLDSLVMFADYGDRVTVDHAAQTTLTVSGPMAKGVPDDATNLVSKASAALGVPARIHLEKQLPAAAGIGGGSSDAAATLRALAKLDSRSVPEPLALSLGADVPVCLLARGARMAGIGEQVSAVQDLPRLHAVLVNPGVSVPTPSVFKALAVKSNPAMPSPLPAFPTGETLIAWLASQRNDLEAAAIQCAPIIRTVLDALEMLPETRLARMSGSGATCFGLFDTQQTAARAAARIRDTYPGWWVQAVNLT